MLSYKKNKAYRNWCPAPFQGSGADRLGDACVEGVYLLLSRDPQVAVSSVLIDYRPNVFLAAACSVFPDLLYSGAVEPPVPLGQIKDDALNFYLQMRSHRSENVWGVAFQGECLRHSAGRRDDAWQIDAHARFERRSKR